MLALDPIDNVLLGGGFRGIVDLGQGPLDTGVNDRWPSALVVKLAP